MAAVGPTETKTTETSDPDVDIETKTTSNDSATEEAVQKARQAAMARLMVNPDHTRHLTIYPQNKYGGKQGRCQFDTSCMHLLFPPALINDVQKSNMVSRHFGNPAIYYPNRKTIWHVEQGLYVVMCRGERHYANGKSHGDQGTEGLTYWRFEDEIDKANVTKEPQSVCFDESCLCCLILPQVFVVLFFVCAESGDGSLFTTNYE